METENLRSLFQMFVRRFGFLHEQCCDSCCGEDISLLQSHILYEITRQKQPSMQEVAGALGIDITTFSRQIKTLVDKDLVKKTPHPDDNRVNILSLTQKGKSMESNIDRTMNDYLTHILSHLSEYERDSVIRSVQLLDDAMKKSQGFSCPPR
ncbi:MarR family winged helix-turn-helix transcriptional regulator [Ferdinandcohnia sp. Marseille-Q9671]